MTNNQPVYLRPNIMVEPLIDQWYAWSHLVPPANAARNLTERHLKIMDSYIDAPHIHAAAVKNPQMRGGPFMDYDSERVDEIRALRDGTKLKRAQSIELSAGLSTVDNILRLNAKGASLNSLYGNVPSALKGYIELVYDLNSNPSYRLLESLLYKSVYYRADGQSLALSAISRDDRPFVLSTPRLNSANQINIAVPFSSEIVDQLFRMKSQPKPIATIRDAVRDLEGRSALFESFFTAQPPPQYVPYTGKGVRWRYFGHACILIETQGVAILVDPVLSYSYESGISRYTYQDLPDYIDYVLITHSHTDHILFETLIQIRHKVGTVIVPRSGGGALQDPSLKLMLENIGFSSVRELGELETVHCNEFMIAGLPFLGEHADLDIRTKLAYLVQMRKHRVIFAADSCNVEPAFYEHVSRIVGPVDVMFIGMECDGAPLSWLYGPLLTRPIDRAADQSRRLAGCNCDQALKVVEQFKCKEVYVYAMGQEPWLNYIMSVKYTEQSRPMVESNRLIQECLRRGIIAERLFGEREILIEP